MSSEFQTSILTENIEQSIKLTQMSLHLYINLMRF